MPDEEQTTFSISQKSVGIIVVGFFALTCVIAVFVGNELVTVRQNVNNNSTDVAVIKSQVQSLKESFSDSTEAMKELTKELREYNQKRNL